MKPFSGIETRQEGRADQVTTRQKASNRPETRSQGLKPGGWLPTASSARGASNRLKPSQTGLENLLVDTTRFSPVPRLWVASKLALELSPGIETMHSSRPAVNVLPRVAQQTGPENPPQGYWITIRMQLYSLAGGALASNRLKTLSGIWETFSFAYNQSALRRP